MENKNFDFIIIGAGPAGIFAALEMAQKRPQSRVLIVDTGRAISHRACPARIDGQCKHCDPCAIVHGWAGAGAFSDGKLSLSDEVGGHVSDYIGHKRAMDYIHQADDIYLSFGASKTVHGLNNSRVDEIAYEASRYNIRLVPCPVRHLGTENAGPVLGAMHDYLVTKTNTTFLELTSAEDILCEGGKVTGVKIHQRGHEPEIVYAPYVVTAPGRAESAGETRSVGKIAAGELFRQAEYISTFLSNQARRKGGSVFPPARHGNHSNGESLKSRTPRVPAQNLRGPAWY